MPEQAARGKKSKSRDDRPARARYWSRRTLEIRKARQLTKGKRTKAEVVAMWRRARQGRVPDGWLPAVVKA